MEPCYNGAGADAQGCAPDLSLSQSINSTEAMTAFVSQLPDFEFAKSVDIVSAVKGKSANKYKKRLGAKQVKNFEKNAAGFDGLLKSNAATNFRAVSARYRIGQMVLTTLKSSAGNSPYLAHYPYKS